MLFSFAFALAHERQIKKRDPLATVRPHAVSIIIVIELKLARSAFFSLALLRSVSTLSNTILIRFDSLSFLFRSIMCALHMAYRQAGSVVFKHHVREINLIWFRCRIFLYSLQLLLMLLLLLGRSLWQRGFFQCIEPIGRVECAILFIFYFFLFVVQRSAQWECVQQFCYHCRSRDILRALPIESSIYSNYREWNWSVVSVKMAFNFVASGGSRGSSNAGDTINGYLSPSMRWLSINRRKCDICIMHLRKGKEGFAI